MTLREQIIAIHKKHFNPEFHEYRQDLLPAMLNDLAMKLFDDLQRFQEPFSEDSSPFHGPDFYWGILDSVDMLAIKEARRLMSTCGLRENTPAVE